MYLSIQYNKSKNFINNVSAIQLHREYHTWKNIEKLFCVLISRFYYPFLVLFVYNKYSHLQANGLLFSSKRVTTIKSAQKQNKYECGFYEGMQCAQK